MDDFNFGTMVGKAASGEAIFDMPNQVVVFYTRPVLVPFESEKAGRPVYRGADYVRISTPGERDEIDREALPMDKLRFKRKWQAYQEGREEIPVGAALSTLFPGHPEIVAGLNAIKFHTIEQLANASDHAVQNLPLGGTEWREKAKRFLAVTKDAGRFGELEQRQADLDATLKRQADENEALRIKIAALEAPAETKQSARR